MSTPNGFRHWLKRCLAYATEHSPASLRTKVLGKQSGIFTYHRIVNPEDVPWQLESGMYVRPETFRMQMELLSKEFNVISPEEYAERLISAEDIPDRTVAITFDDGWLDTWANAKPILEEFSLPATVFLATAFIGEDKLFWTDQIALAMRQQPEEVYKLLKEFKFLTPLTSKNSNPMLSKENITIEQVLFLLKAAAPNNRKKILQAIAKLELSTERQFMNWQEASDLSKTKLRLGSHSHSHQFSNELSPEELQTDVQKSIALIKSHSPNSLSSLFCYPGGVYSSASQKALLNQGFLASLAVHRQHKLSQEFPLIGRVNVHQDVSYTPNLLKLKLSLQPSR